MDWIRALAPGVLACCTAIVSLSALAQTESAVGKRQKVDVRVMAPGPQASDAASDPQSAGGLTRNQRKEATLQARQEGTLRPTGEAADLHDAKSAPLASAAGASSSAPGAPAEAVVVDAAPPTQVTAAIPSPTKKSKSKKARPPSAVAPA